MVRTILLGHHSWGLINWLLQIWRVKNVDQASAGKVDNARSGWRSSCGGDGTRLRLDVMEMTEDMNFKSWFICSSKKLINTEKGANPGQTKIIPG